MLIGCRDQSCGYCRTVGQSVQMFSGPALVALVELLVDMMGSADFCVVSTLSLGGDGITKVPLDVEPAAIPRTSGLAVELTCQLKWEEPLKYHLVGVG